MITQSNRTEHDVKVQELKERLERSGYTVLVEPQKAALPFDLGNYIPDIVASKADDGIIIEVKGANARTSIERYHSIAQNVQAHAGWRFILVTVDDLNVPTSSQEMINWDQLDAKCESIRQLATDGYSEPAILYLWSVFESAMRKLAITVAIPVERLPATKMMNQLYTAGYISVNDFSIAKKFLNMRNGITHGFGTPADIPLFESFFRIVLDLLREWKNNHNDGERMDR